MRYAIVRLISSQTPLVSRYSKNTDGDIRCASVLGERRHKCRLANGQEFNGALYTTDSLEMFSSSEQIHVILFVCSTLIPTTAHALPIWHYAARQRDFFESEEAPVLAALIRRDTTRDFVSHVFDSLAFDGPSSPHVIADEETERPTPSLSFDDSTMSRRSIVVLDALTTSSSTPSAVPDGPCEMVTTLFTKGLPAYAFPIAALTLLSLTFVTLAAFVIYSVVWRCRLRSKRPLSVIGVKSPTKTQLSITVPSPTLKTMSSSHTLNTISEDPSLYTPTQKTTFSMSPPHSPTPPYTPRKRDESSVLPSFHPLTPTKLDKKLSALKLKD